MFYFCSNSSHISWLSGLNLINISSLSCNESTVQISFHLVRNYAIFGSEFVFYHCGLFKVRAAMLDDGGS